MLIGYNAPRPKEEDYDNFINSFTNGLKRSEIEGLSFMVYGSYVRGDANYGRSDIDGILVFDEDVVIDKINLGVCSKILMESQTGNHVPFQVTVSDLRTLRDGRFNPYNPSFYEYFLDEAEVVFGLDYRYEFDFEMPTHPEQMPLTFNLRKARQGLFFSEYDKKFDYEQFLKRFNKSLDAVSRGSKQVLYMTDGELRINRFSALDAIQEEFPEVNVEPLERIKWLYNHPEQLDDLYYKPMDIIKLWEDSVTFFEEMIREYIERFPHE